MEQAPSLEMVLQALNSLYKESDSTAKEKASSWLMKVQDSIHAWTLADQLLQLNQDEETSYFGAQTLRTKIQFSFNELPSSSYEPLCESLLNHCKKINKDTKHTIVTQLSLALADLALRMVSWKNAIADLMQKMALSPDHSDFLLEILTVYPEEITSRHLRLGENRRNEIYAELKSAAPLFIHFLSSVSDSNPDNVAQLSRVFKCLSSWLFVCAVPDQCLINSKLLQIAFIGVASPQCDINMHAAAAECISSALFAIEDVSNSQQLAFALFDGVQSLVEPYHMMVAQQDLEKCLNFCRIFTETSETLLNSLMKQPETSDGILKMLDILLICVGHNSYELADVTFNFWNRLSDFLYEETNREIVPKFKPYVCRLITALCRLCRHEESLEDVEADDSDFDDFRDRTANLVKEFEFLISADEIFAQLNQSLKECGPNQPWTIIEAALFIMQSVGKRVNCGDSTTLPDLLQFLSNSPIFHLNNDIASSGESTVSMQHAALQSTTLDLLGSLYNWLKAHPACIEQIVPFILQNFRNPKLALSAACALEKLAENCPRSMLSNIPALFHIYEFVDNTPETKPNVIYKLLNGTANILSCLPEKEAVEGLKHLTMPQLERLTKMINSENTGIIRDDKVTDPCIWLDRLGNIFKSFNMDIKLDGCIHPCYNILVQVWPVVSSVMYKYVSNCRVMEHCCRCLRNGIRSFGKNSTSLLVPIISQMVEVYTQQTHSCCLYMGSIMVDEYGKDIANVPFFLKMLEAFNTKTFELVRETDGLLNHPDTVDDLFRLAYRFTEQCPLPFLEFAASKDVFMCALKYCSINHIEANESVVKFLQSFIKLASVEQGNSPEKMMQKQLVQKILSEHGQELVSAVVEACISKVPKRLISYLSGVIFELIKIDKTATSKWLEVALNQLPNEVIGGCISATPEQQMKFFYEIINEEDDEKFGNYFEDFSILFQ